MGREITVALAGLLCLFGSSIAVTAEPFPSFDYEVICYASNIFTQQGKGFLSDISDCKKEQEAARDLMRDVWPKLLTKGQESCVAYAKRYARGSYTRLQECVAYGLLLSFKSGSIVRTPNP